MRHLMMSTFSGPATASATASCVLTKETVTFGESSIRPNWKSVFFRRFSSKFFLKESCRLFAGDGVGVIVVMKWYENGLCVLYVFG